MPNSGRTDGSECEADKGSRPSELRGTGVGKRGESRRRITRDLKKSSGMEAGGRRQRRSWSLLDERARYDFLASLTAVWQHQLPGMRNAGLALVGLLADLRRSREAAAAPPRRLHVH